MNFSCTLLTDEFYEHNVDQKNAHKNEYKIYNSIYMKFKDRKTSLYCLGIYS